MSSNLTPLEVCERLIAPIGELGRIVKMGEKAGYGWRRAAKYRDAGDMPPRVNRGLLKYAKRHGIPLTEKHLIWGASRAEIEALLENMSAQEIAAE